MNYRLVELFRIGVFLQGIAHLRRRLPEFVRPGPDTIRGHAIFDKQARYRRMCHHAGGWLAENSLRDGETDQLANAALRQAAHGSNLPECSRRANRESMRQTEANNRLLA